MLRRERKTQKKDAVAVAAVVVAALALPATAGTWAEDAEIQQPWNPNPVITVLSDGERYTAVEGSSVPYTFYIAGSCTWRGKAAQSSIWIYRQDGTHYRAEHVFWDWPQHQSVDGTYDISVALRADEKQRVVAACNDHLDQQLGQGKSPADVLGANQVIDGPTLYVARHTFNCTANVGITGDAEWDELDAYNRVLCKKSPAGSIPQPPQPLPPGPGGLTQTFGVTRTEVEVTPDHASVVTKADLTVQGEIEVNGPGRVRYRLVHNGQPSDVGTLNFSQAKTWERTWPLTVRCDQEQQQGSNGGGIGGLVGAPPNVRTGTVRIEILEPTSGVRVSEEAPYSVNCRETGDLATPQPDLTILGVKASDASDNALVRVRNRGAAGAPATQLWASRPGAPHTQVLLPAIGEGQQVEVQIALPAAVGGAAAAVTFIVDPDDTVHESDETNNQLTP